MDFFKSIQTCFQKYIDFNGRARRSEFWYFILFVAIGGFILGILDLLLFESARTSHDGSIAIRLDFIQIGFDGDFNEPLSDSFGLLTLIPVISAGVRRLHDIDKTGWYILMPYIPLLLMAVYFGVSIDIGSPGIIVGTLAVAAFLLCIVLIIMLVHDEGPGANKYGESPKYGDDVAIA